MALAKKIDHLAIAVNDLDGAVHTFTSNFGFPVAGRTQVPQLGIALALLQVGDAQLELFTPTAPGTPPAKFLAEQGEGMYVLSLEVDNLDAAVQMLTARGIKVGAVTPTGDGTGRLVFVSPKATHGVLLQLIERPKA
jgi:methylmalonyl-CoA/ethylmalonyl-CoA epimerase